MVELGELLGAEVLVEGEWRGRVVGAYIDPQHVDYMGRMTSLLLLVTPVESFAADDGAELEAVTLDRCRLLEVAALAGALQ